MIHKYTEKEALNLSASAAAESVTKTQVLSAMTAGTTYTGVLQPAPILDSLGEWVGEVGDSSFSATGSIFTTEVSSLNLVLANGDYCILYETGYYKVKAAASATPTATFKVKASFSPIVGSVASGTTDSGNPVKIGGVYNTTLPTLTNGQRGDVQLGSRASLHTTLMQAGSTNPIAAAAPADAVVNANQISLGANAFNSLFNGTTLDRQRANVDQTVGITAAGVTTTQTGADQTNYNSRGLHVVLDMTTVGTGSVTLSIQGKDVASGKYYTILSGAAVTTNSTNVYKVYPGITAAANVSASDILPRTFRIVVTANNANATTYTVGASIIN